MVFRSHRNNADHIAVLLAKKCHRTCSFGFIDIHDLSDNRFGSKNLGINHSLNAGKLV